MLGKRVSDHCKSSDERVEHRIGRTIVDSASEIVVELPGDTSFALAENLGETGHKSSLLSPMLHGPRHNEQEQ